MSTLCSGKLKNCTDSSSTLDAKSKWHQPTEAGHKMATQVGRLKIQLKLYYTNHNTGLFAYIKA